MRTWSSFIKLIRELESVAIIQIYKATVMFSNPTDYLLLRFKNELGLWENNEGVPLVKLWKESKHNNKYNEWIDKLLDAHTNIEELRTQHFKKADVRIRNRMNGQMFDSVMVPFFENEN